MIFFRVSGLNESPRRLPGEGKYNSDFCRHKYVKNFFLPDQLISYRKGLTLAPYPDKGETYSGSPGALRKPTQVGANLGVAILYGRIFRRTQPQNSSSDGNDTLGLLKKMLVIFSLSTSFQQHTLAAKKLGWGKKILGFA